MKVKPLLTLALLAAGTCAFAQKDITKQYIKNATLSNGTTGWTVKNFNAPQKGNNTVGYASESYAGWGALETTAFGLTQNITLPAGSYRLANYSFFRQGQNFDTNKEKSLAVLKAGDATVPVATLGSVVCNGYSNSQAEGANAFDAKMYRNAVEFTLAEEKTIEIGLVGTFDEMRSWCIAGMFELFDLNEEATADNPTDVTYLIQNSGFETRDLSGWVNNGMQTQSNAAYTLKAGGYYAEKWQASGALPDCGISQTLSNLPAGYYTLSANCSYGGNGARIFAGDNETLVEAGKAGNYSVNAKVAEGGSLEIGYKLVNGTSNYLCVDGFKLSYYPINLTAMKESLAQLVAEAQAMLTDNMGQPYLTQEFVDAVNNAIAAAELLPTDGEDEIIAKISALTAANEANAAALDVLIKNYTKAHPTPGTDLTYAIVNAEVNGSTGWTCDMPHKGNGPLLNGTAFEYWGGNATSRDEASFDYWQTITGLADGVYTLKAKMYNSLNGEAGAEFAPTCGLYATSGDETFKTLVDVDSETLAEYTLENVIVKDGTLRLGVKSFERMAARWFVADDFKLTYVGEYTPAIDPKEYSFEVVADAETFTVTPSDEEVSYYIDIVPAGNYTPENLEPYGFASAAAYFDFLLEDMGAGLEYFTGVQTQSYAKDWYIDEDGDYEIYIFAVDSDYKRVSDITVKAFNYDSTVLGIKNIKAAKNAIKFNLNGQRVNNAKGIILMNGKKYIQK